MYPAHCGGGGGGVGDGQGSYVRCEWGRGVMRTCLWGVKICLSVVGVKYVELCREESEGSEMSE